MPRFSPALRRVTAVVAGSAFAAGGCYAVLGASTGVASSHREAPLTAADPQVDNTDTYAFVSPENDGTVTLIANWIPFEDPAGGPNFYPWATGDEARYNIKVDTDGDAVADVTYQWEFQDVDTRGAVDYPLTLPDGTTQPQGNPDADGSFIYNIGPVNSFNDATLLFKQTYTLTAIDDAGVETELVAGAPVAPSNVGAASMPNYQALRDEAIVPALGGITAFAGQADDSFFLDLRVFDLLYGGDLTEAGNDTLAPYNVNSVALKIPIANLADADAPGDPVIGVWSTTDRASVTTRAAGAVPNSVPSGPFVQVSRLGNPLVNEVVIPASLKDAFNSIPPSADGSVTAAVNKVLNPELPYLLNAVYGLPIPATPRNDLATIFLTGIQGLNAPANPVASEQLRLNTSIPASAPGSENRLGVLGGDNAGFPNGRRLTDDVLDIAVQAVAGAVTVADTDGNGIGEATNVTIVPALAAGDGVNTNQVAFASTFPYLALPNSGSAVAAAPTVTQTVTATATTTATVTASAGARNGTMPRGGIDTGDARTASSQLPLVLTGGVLLVLAAGTYSTVALRRRRAAGTHR